MASVASPRIHDPLIAWTLAGTLGSWRSYLGARIGPARYVSAGCLILTLLGCQNPPPPQPSDGTATDHALADEPGLENIDIEPSNDRAETAPTLERSGTGQLTPTDIDWYDLQNLQTYYRVEVEVGEEAANSVRVEVRDDGDLTRAPGNDPRTRVQPVSSQGGRYLLVAAVGLVDVDYTLRLTPLDLEDAGPIAVEPSSFASPTPLSSFPARISGYLEPRETADVFSLNVSALRETRGVALEVAPVPGARLALGVYAAPDALLTQITAARIGEGIGIPNFGPPSSFEQETLLVAVWNEGEPVDEPYTLSVYTSPLADEMLELEPNDTFETHHPLRRVQRLVGVLHREADRDVFARSFDRGDSTTLIATPRTDRAALTIQLSTTDDVLMEASSAAGEAVILCSRGVPSGTVFAVVTGTLAGDVLTTYELTWREEAAGTEVEPNDQLRWETLQSISSSDSRRGFTDREGDTDAFRWHYTGLFDALEGPVVSVHPPPEVDVALELYDSAGDPIAQEDDGGRGEPEFLASDPAGGDFIIVVRGVRGSGCESAYRLEIE